MGAGEGVEQRRGADDAAIAACMRALLGRRNVDATLCPSEVARALWPPATWRDAMPVVRAVASALARSGELQLRRGGGLLDPDAPGMGPLRIGRGPRFDGPRLGG